MHGRSVPKLEKVYDQLEAIDGAPRPSIAVLDLAAANAESYTTLASSIEDEFGQLDGLVHNACIASICGNVNIWKPSPKTPLCGVAVQKIINEALAGTDLPPVFFLINDGSNQLAQQFVDDTRVNLVSFTGSCAVGRQVSENVSARMGKCLLELGGNNAIIAARFLPHK